jgi:hypothetical protein
MHQVALLGPQAPEDSLYWQMVSNHSEEVANWHFSADPKPVDMVWGSIAFPALEAASHSRATVPADTNLIEAATRTTRPQTGAKRRSVFRPRWVAKGQGQGRTQTASGERHL